MSIVVRRPVFADVARLATINVETWRAAYAGIVPADYLDSRDHAEYEQRWRLNITQGRPGVSYIAAELDGLVAGYAICGPYRPQHDSDPSEDTATWAELYAIYTHPDQQGHGVGTAIHDAALDQMERDGYHVGALWVLRANAASLRWYDARGWRPDGATSSWEGAGPPLEEVRLVRALGSG
jgi:GNAT superfamily N-acetyltransferase